MIKGEPISFKSEFQEDLYYFLHNDFLKRSPYYEDFDILRELISEISEFLSTKIDDIKKELFHEGGDVAASLHQQYGPLIQHSHDLAFKSTFLIIYASFENCLNEIKKLLIEQFTGSSKKGNAKDSPTLLLEFLYRRRDLKLEDVLDLFSYLSLLEKGTEQWEKIGILNKIRNNIVHNASIVKESDKKKLLQNLKKIGGIEINKKSYELRIIDIHFLYNSIDIFQSLFDEIYKNSEKV